MYVEFNLCILQQYQNNLSETDVCVIRKKFLEALEASYNVAREVIEVDEVEEGNISAAAGKQDK